MLRNPSPWRKTKAFVIGPDAQRMLRAIDQKWRQGQHVLITGGTGTGKTLLARQLARLRVSHGGHVVIFMCKLQEDKTITDDFAGWTRWKRWKKRPAPYENQVLLWPDVRGMGINEAKAHMKEVFAEAMDEFAKIGKWCVIFDEGLFFTSASGLNFAGEAGSLSQLIRSGKGTLIFLAQRPAHLPLSIYANIDYAFIGSTNNVEDRKRISEFGRFNTRELEAMIQANSKHEFLCIPVNSDEKPERIDLKK